MDTSRLRIGELIAGIAAVILFIVMFLPWFGFDLGVGSGLEQAEDLGFAVPDVEDSVSLNAFEAFDFIDLILLVTVLVAVGLAVATAMARSVALPVAASAITAGLGILSTLLIIYRIIDTPGGTDRKWGVFVGLVAAAAIAYGGWRSMQEEGTTFAGEADRLGDRTGGPGDAGAPPPGPGAPPPTGGPSGGPPPRT